MTRPGSHGFALAASVFALVLLAALIAGVFFAARQEMRIGENVQSAERAFDAAEAGLHSALARWDPGAYDALPPGGAAAFSGLLEGGSGSYSGTVLRLNRRLFLVRSTGQDPSRESRRSLASLVRLMPESLTLNAALTVTGELVVSGGTLVVGEDQQPAGWDCPAAGRAVAGVAIRDASRLSVAGCADSSCIHGVPAVSIVPTLGDSAQQGAAGASWAALAAMATKFYEAGATASPSPVGTSTTCDTGAPDNWGSTPVPPDVSGCARFYPVIYARGDLRVTGGTGQGILLVAGDLEVEGGFTFLGPVVVRGKLTVAGGGGRFIGGILASSAVLQPAGTGSADIAFSSCALANTLLSKARAVPLAERAWVELY
jgi:hypothetical protein